MDSALSMIARKHLLEGFRRNMDMLSQTSALEPMLDEFIDSRRPTMHDYDNRRDLIRILNEIAKEIYGENDDCPLVEEFGSFLMDMFNSKSDLDLSINFSDKKAQAQRDTKIKALRKFANKFYVLQKTKHVTNVQPILNARVPVLKVTDCGTGIECDLSVGNMDGIAKSHIILMISSIDERFKKLCFLMKAWAKAHDINSSKDGTLNSLSLILVVAFHFQIREQPIFPPFSSIFKDGTNPEAVKKNIPNYLNYGNRNKESLADLFVSLLVMLESAETLWPMGQCISAYEGSWICKTWESKKGQKIGLISIEDFTDRSQNTARAVRIKKIAKIYSCIRDSVQQICSFTDGRISAEKLKSRLFGSNSGTENLSIKNIAHPTPQEPNLEESTLRKRKRAEQKREKKKLKNLQGKSLAGTQSQPLLHSNFPQKLEKKHFKQPDGNFVHRARPSAPLHSNPPFQRSVRFTHERSHAEIWRCPTPNLHPLAPRSASALPYHSTPNIPHVPHIGLERPRNYGQPLPFTPFHDTVNFMALDPYTRSVETNYQHNRRGAYPPFYHRAS